VSGYVGPAFFLTYFRIGLSMIIYSSSFSYSYKGISHPFEVGIGKRQQIEHFDFPAGKFSTPPRVSIAINGISIINSGEIDYAVSVSNVTTTGFDAVIGVYENTIVTGIRASWIAYEE
jgi:hypothetical protein